MRQTATDHACKVFRRLVLFSLLAHQAQATAVVHMALRVKYNFLLRAGLHLAEQGQTHSTDTAPQKSENGQVKHRAAPQSCESVQSCHGPHGLTSLALRAGRLTYFFVLELAQGPDSSKMPTRTSPVWQTLHNLLDGDCPLFCWRRAAHCWWGVGNPGTPVILHNRAGEHSENLQRLVVRNTAKKIRSLPTGSLLL